MAREKLSGRQQSLNFSREHGRRAWVEVVVVQLLLQVACLAERANGGAHVVSCVAMAPPAARCRVGPGVEGHHGARSVAAVGDANGLDGKPRLGCHFALIASAAVVTCALLTMGLVT
jgi:hypothetical protein